MDNVSSSGSANLTNATSTSSVLTQTELWIQFIVFYLIINGVGSAVCNSLIFLAIVMERKRMNSRFFVIVGSLALARASEGIQLIFTTGYRILRTLGFASIPQVRFKCFMIHFVLYFGNTLELALLIVLVIDRVMAIAAIDRYRHLTPRQALEMCGALSIIIAIFKLILAYTTDFNVPDPVACMNMYSPTGANFNVYAQHIDFVLIVLLLLIYLWLVIDLRRRTLKAATSTELEAALKRRARVMPAIRNLVLLHCAFTLTARLIGLLSTVPIFKPQADRIIAYQGMMICCDNLASGLALVTSNNELRSTMKRVFLCRGNNVGTWMTGDAGTINRRQSTINLRQSMELSRRQSVNLGAMTRKGSSVTPVQEI